MNHKKTPNGFTLMELMIAVAVIGILASVAYPSYVDNIRRSKRAEARSMLLENAQFMERVFTENNSYLVGASATAPTLPNTVAPKGATGSKVNYTISFSASGATATSYTIEATSSNTMTYDKCGKLTYNNLGQKTATPTGDMTTESCWAK